MSETIDLSHLDLPTRKQEAWKYTDLSRLIRHADSALLAPGDTTEASALLNTSLVEANCERLVFVDGQYDVALSTSPLRPEALEQASADGDATLAAISALTRQCQYRLDIGTAPAGPLHLLYLHSSGQSVLSSTRLRIEVAQGVEVSLIEEHLGGRLGVAIQQQGLALAAGAHVKLTRLQHLAKGQFLIGTSTATLADDAHLHEIHAEWGGRLSRLQAWRDLNGRNSRSDYYALSGLTGSQQVDHQLQVRHASPQATSRLRSRGIVGGSARQVFNGKVLVERGAQGTDSDQLLRNLLLSDKAEVDAKPELEIYADDVRCAHGSTVGRLDDQALFYLRSRGLSADHARRLLMLSFAAGVLSEIEDSELRGRVQRPLAEHLSLGVQA